MKHRGVSLIALSALLMTNKLYAIDFSFFDEKLHVDLSSTINYGASWRTSSRKEALTGGLNGGNFNYAKGDLFSHRITGNHDLQIDFEESFGVFLRASYFYDQAIDNESIIAEDVSEVEQRAISSFDLLDHYFWAQFGSLNIRVGSQVISWGENLFIQGSLNEINTFDVGKLRVPGSSLKDALLPNEAFYVQYSVTPTLTVEGFYMWDFDEVELDPAGLFFNSNTAFSPGGTTLGPLARVEGDDWAKNGGQYGFALRYFANNVGNGVEFGAYWMNVHDHAPQAQSAFGSGTFQLVYPEDLKIMGLSFNTQVGSVAWSGEWSHRRNAPVLFGDLISPGFGLVADYMNGVAPAAGTIVPMWSDEPTQDQIQSNIFVILPTWMPRMIGAETSSLFAEVAVGRVDDLPSSLLFVPGVTDSYWGYQISTSATYNRAIAGVINLIPGVSFSHNVNGVSRESSPIFLEGRRAMTLKVDWEYLANLSGSVSYSFTWGGKSHRNAFGGQVNSRRDRDWVTVSVSYSY